MRGTRHSSSDGQAVHLLGVIDQQARAVLAQAAVDGKTNEITQFAPLLEDLDITGAVITADALHTQRQHAKFLVSDKKAHYILVVKKNQPPCTPRSRTCLALHPGRLQAARPGSRPRRTPHPQSRRRHDRACFPHAARPFASPAGPAPERQEEMADLHHLRHYQPDRRPGHRRPARRMDTRSLADRGAAPHPRCHLRRRRLPDPHRQRTQVMATCATSPSDLKMAGHTSIATACRHHAATPPAPGHPRAQPAMTETDITPLCRGLG